MHVCIDVSPTVQQHAGLGRYAGEVARALDQAGAVELSLFYNRQGQNQLPDYLSHLPRRTVNIGNKPWRMAVLMSQLLHWPLDKTFGANQIFHATNHLLAHFGRARTVFTLHDLIFLHFPAYHLPYNRWYLTLAMPRFLQAADIIVTPSECSRQDALKFYGLPESKIKVIYEAPAPDFKPVIEPMELERIRQEYHLPAQFILHVGTIEPRKNLGRLLDAYHSLLPTWPELKLVLVGKKGWLYDSFFQQLQQSGLAECVILPGYVKETDLPAFYQLARLFVYPSLYEGFGLGPIEAMACGTPVVCSNSSSLPEVVGSAGLLVDPTDTAGLAAALRRVLAEPDLSADLRQRSIAQAGKFSWAKTAAQLTELYYSLIRPND